MQNLFELPELLTIGGDKYISGDGLEYDGSPNTCDKGCSAGCHNGGCFVGSKEPIIDDP